MSLCQLKWAVLLKVLGFLLVFMSCVLVYSCNCIRHRTQLVLLDCTTEPVCDQVKVLQSNRQHTITLSLICIEGETVSV